MLERLFCYPRLISFTATVSDVAVIDPQGYCQLGLGDVTSLPGIEFTAVVEVPRHKGGGKCTGQLEFVQDVITLRTRTPGQLPGPVNPKECFSSNGARVLDTSDPYDTPTPVNGPGRYTVSTNDSPSSPLRHTEIVTASDQFRMFLMWRPSAFNGLIRLPLGRIEWSWDGEAMVNKPQYADCTEGNNGWSLMSPPTDHTSSAAIVDANWPTTSPNVTSLTWQKC